MVSISPKWPFYLGEVIFHSQTMAGVEKPFSDADLPHGTAPLQPSSPKSTVSHHAALPGGWPAPATGAGGKVRAKIPSGELT